MEGKVICGSHWDDQPRKICLVKPAKCIPVGQEECTNIKTCCDGAQCGDGRPKIFGDVLNICRLTLWWLIYQNILHKMLCQKCQLKELKNLCSRGEQYKELFVVWPFFFVSSSFCLWQFLNLNVLSSTYLAVHIYATKHRPQNSPNFEKWNVLLVNCCKKIKQVPKKYMVKKIFVYSTSTEIRGFHTVK